MTPEQQIQILEDRVTALEKKLEEQSKKDSVMEHLGRIEELQKRMYSMTDATLKASLEFPVRILDQIKELRELILSQGDSK